MSTTTKKQKGFTLIEILIVISIITILATMGISSFSNSGEVVKFNNFTNQIASLFREARSLALTGEAIGDYTDYDEDKVFYPESGTCPVADTIPTACPGANDGKTDCFCSEDEKILAAGYGVSFGFDTITPFTDLHNQSEGYFSETGDYGSTKDKINTIKKVSLNEDTSFKDYGMMINSPSRTSGLIYTTPYGDATFNNIGDKDLLIWLYDKNVGCEVNGEAQGKVISVNKVAGIPEVLPATSLSTDQKAGFSINCNQR